MKKFAVLGTGLMGRVVVKDIFEKAPDAQVTLIDINEALLKELYNFIGQTKLKVCMLSRGTTKEKRTTIVLSNCLFFRECFRCLFTKSTNIKER